MGFRMERSGLTDGVKISFTSCACTYIYLFVGVYKKCLKLDYINIYIIYVYNIYLYISDISKVLNTF